MANPINIDIDNLVPVFDELPLEVESAPQEQPEIQKEESQTEILPEDSGEEIIQEETEEEVQEQPEEVVIEESTKEALSEDAIEEVKPDPNALAKTAYEFYVDQGILLPEEGVEINSLADVENQMKKLPTLVAQELVNASPEFGKQLIDFVFTKGQNLSFSDLQEYYSTYLDDLQASSTQQFTSQEEARAYLKETYISQGTPEVAVEAMLDAMEVSEEGKILEQANNMLEKSRPKTSKAQEILLAEKAQKEKLREQQTKFTQLVNEEIKNLDWRAPRKNVLRQSLASGKFQETLNQVISSPSAFIQLANFLTYYQDGNFKFDDFIKQLQSKPAASLKEALKKDMFTSSSKKSISRPSSPKKGGINLDDLEIVV